MSEKSITVSAVSGTPNEAERAVDHLVAAGFTATDIVERTTQGQIEVAVHCDTTEEMDAAKHAFKDTAAKQIDARTENERIFSE